MPKVTEPYEAIRPGFLSIERAARWSSVSTKTVRRWIEQGLPVYQAGPKTKVLIEPEHIRTFLTKRQAERPALDALVDEVMGDLNACPAKEIAKG